MLFKEQVARKPNLYPWTQTVIDRMWAGFWTPNEFDFRADYNDFKVVLNDQERQIVTRTLSAIGQIEIAVKTFWARVGDHFPHPAISDLGYVMSQSEVIHNIAYEKALDTFNLNDVFQANLKEPVVKGRVAYLRKHLKTVYARKSRRGVLRLYDKLRERFSQTYRDQVAAEDEQMARKQYVYSIILFTLFVENVSLFSQFYVILWFNRFYDLPGDRKDPVLKDTAQQVQYTRNEEMLHAQVGIMLINTLRKEYPELFDEELEEIVVHECREAFKAESRIIDWMLGDFDRPGLNAPLLKTFIQNRLEESLRSIGFTPDFDLPVSEEHLAATLWMDEETLGNNVVDFFHKKPVDYAKKTKVYTRQALFGDRNAATA
ncbi:ribonucleotide-diphosphate reductase subunit beta [Aureimonas sp. AU40]|uniref:ribonucleotide-diphosphate reductase subunit beta n=1 Tax=Aureimonas sp. AU40 TaxID=1637747 RepID=UPI000783AA81|nr:ribonucleotide-diphosphate reductase subunit beta [Aureimonas sp. AU40]